MDQRKQSDDLPLVTIVTPSFQQGQYIKSTIESVLTQDYPHIEYIIIDNLSVDETPDIVREYEGRLTFVSQKDHGQSDALNKGFRMAKGEIVAWLNADDVYEPGCIQKAVEAFKKNTNLGLIYADGYTIDQYGNKTGRFKATQEFEAWELVHVQDYILQPTTFFRKNCLEKAGYLDESLNWCMDWDLWIRMSRITEITYVPEFFACAREYPGTKTSTGGRERLLEIRRLMQKYSGKKRPAGYWLYWTAQMQQTYKDKISVIFCMKMINVLVLIVIKYQKYRLKKKTKAISQIGV